MKLQRDRDLESVFVGAIREAMSEPRDGVHRSSLFPCARRGKAVQVLKLALEEDEALFFAQGRAVHSFVVGHRFQPVEESLQRDGILDTPDGWSDVAGRRVPVEFKSTRLSSRDFPDQVGGQELAGYKGAVKEYLWQLLDHCLFAGVDTGVLAILFFMGDYGAKRKWCPKCKERVSWMECKACGWKGKRTELRVYAVKFGLPELKARWPEFQKRKKAYVATDDPLQVPASPCWQCQNCKPGKAAGCEYYGKEFK